jgi:hypothetical protein
MERRGTIDRQLRAAAESFRRTFYAAQLDQLKAKDLSRPFVQNARHGEPSQHAYIARARVWGVMGILVVFKPVSGPRCGTSLASNGLSPGSAERDHGKDRGSRKRLRRVSRRRDRGVVGIRGRSSGAGPALMLYCNNLGAGNLVGIDD